MPVSFFLIIIEYIVKTKQKKNTAVATSKGNKGNDFVKEKPAIAKNEMNRIQTSEQTRELKKVPDQTAEYKSPSLVHPISSKGRVENFEETSITRKIPIALQRSVYREIVCYVVCIVSYR